MNNISTTTCEYVEEEDATTINCISQLPEYFYNGFSYGDILIIMFLIFTFTLLFFKTLKQYI